MSALAVDLKFDPSKFSKETLRLILATAQQRKCSPDDALLFLLDELARMQGFTPPPREAQAA